MLNQLNQTQIKFNKILTAYLCGQRVNQEFVNYGAGSGASDEDLIMALYEDFSDKLAKAKPKTVSNLVSFKEDFDFSKFKKLSSKYSVINFLKEGISQELGKFIKVFFLQGSFASADFLENWSDLDVMLIFNEELFKDRKNLILARKVLRKFAPLFYKIDPLAHHRFQIATALDITYYPQFILPLVVYQNGLRLFGQKELEIKLRDDSFEKARDLSSRAKHFRKRMLCLPKNMVELKLDLSHLFLLPSLLLQIKGIYLLKKFSFEKVKDEFPQIDFQVIDDASIMREKWRVPNIIKHYPNFFINYLPGPINNLAIKFFAYCIRKTKPPISEKEVENLIARIHNLFEDALQYVLKLKEKNES